MSHQSFRKQERIKKSFKNAKLIDRYVQTDSLPYENDDSVSKLQSSFKGSFHLQ